MWRIVSLKLTLLFCPDKTLLQHKLDKYRVALKVFGETSCMWHFMYP